MKKILTITFIMITVLFMTGCNASSKESAGIHSALVKKGILEKDMTFVENYTLHKSNGIPYTAKYYIYQKKDGSKIALGYSKNTNDKTFTANIYSVDSQKKCYGIDNYSGDCCEGCYDKTTNTYYDLNLIKTYKLKENKTLFFRSYEIID